MYETVMVNIVRKPAYQRDVLKDNYVKPHQKPDQPGQKINYPWGRVGYGSLFSGQVGFT